MLPEGRYPPVWITLNDGKEIQENINAEPGLAVGYDRMSGCDYTGTFYVNTK